MRSYLKVLALLLAPLIVNAQTISDAINSSPASCDSSCGVASLVTVSTNNSAAATRNQLYSGASTTVTFLKGTNSVLYVTLAPPGRAAQQVAVDLQTALSMGYFKLYNYGGENADRDYGATVSVSQSGSYITLQTNGVAFMGPATIYNVVGFEL